MSKKNVPALVSAMGLSSELILRLVETSRQRGLPDNALYELTTPQGQQIVDRMIDVLEEHYQVPVTIDYSHDISVYCEALCIGAHGVFDAEAVREFPRQTAVAKTVKWSGSASFFFYEIPPQTRVGDGAKFVKKTCTDIARRGYRPLVAEELLALCIQHPELSMKHTLFAFGTLDERDLGSGPWAMFATRHTKRGWRVGVFNAGRNFHSDSVICVPAIKV